MCKSWYLSRFANAVFSIYVELADQYKDMDPVSNVVKRNVLADHLREVIDILEQKVRILFILLDKSMC